MSLDPEDQVDNLIEQFPTVPTPPRQAVDSKMTSAAGSIFDKKTSNQATFINPKQKAFLENQQKRREELLDKLSAKNKQKEALERERKKMKQIRGKYEELTSAFVHDDLVKHYNWFMCERLRGRPKPDHVKRFHVGLAGVQKAALLGQLQRNESKDTTLFRSDASRASLLNLNQTS